MGGGAQVPSGGNVVAVPKTLLYAQLAYKDEASALKRKLTPPQKKSLKKSKNPP